MDEVEAQDDKEWREFEGWDKNMAEESGSGMDESGVEGWEKNGKEEEGEYNETEKEMQKLSQSDSDEIKKGKAVVHQIGE